MLWKDGKNFDASSDPTLGAPYGGPFEVQIGTGKVIACLGQGPGGTGGRRPHPSDRAASRRVRRAKAPADRPNGHRGVVVEILPAA